MKQDRSGINIKICPQNIFGTIHLMYIDTNMMDVCPIVLVLHLFSIRKLFDSKGDVRFVQECRLIQSFIMPHEEESTESTLFANQTLKQRLVSDTIHSKTCYVGNYP